MIDDDLHLVGKGLQRCDETLLKSDELLVLISPEVNGDVIAHPSTDDVQTLEDVSNLFSIEHHHDLILPQPTPICTGVGQEFYFCALSSISSRSCRVYREAIRLALSR